MDSYEQYEKECQEIRKENKKILASFKKWLLQQNTSEKTVKKHVSNADFYINEFLLYEEAIKAHEGAYKIDMFLGYWFIKKAMWASKTTIKENATSLKKFYQYLHIIEKIDIDSLEELKSTVKQCMPEWLETLERYDNPDFDESENIWF